MNTSISELTIPDVITDNDKNLLNVYKNEDDDEAYLLNDSLYYTESEFLDLLKNKDITNGKNLTVISINIANLLSKLSSLKLFLNNITSPCNKPDVIVVVETHLSKAQNSGFDDSDLKKLIPGYVFFQRGRQTKRGGGVGVFINQDLSSEAGIFKEANKVPFIEEHFENIVIQIPEVVSTGNNTFKKDLIIAAVYRPPNQGNSDIFQEGMETLLKTLDKRKHEIIIAGDFNLDLLKYSNHIPTGAYLDLISEYRFLPRIVRPTRIKKQSATLIDHILTKDTGYHIVSGIVDIEIAGGSGYTDHLPTFTVIKIGQTPQNRNETITKTYFTTDDHEKRRNQLRAENWEEVYALSDANEIYDLIQSKYGKHYHESKTTKTYKKRSNKYRREPWMTNELLADMRKRDRLAKNKEKRTEYKKLRNEIVAKVRKAEREYVKKQIDENIGDIKKHWSIIRSVTNKTNNKEDVTTGFYYLGNFIEDDQENANCMNDYLANIGKETNESVGRAKNNPMHYLQKHCQANQNSLLFSDVTALDVAEACKKFTLKTSSDSSGFQQNIVLKDIDLMAPIIAHLVNVSQATGVFPENGKIARVIPIYKNKGSKQLYENYRPVSLLPILSKIIERLIYNKLFDFLVRYDIIFDSQYGFRTGHSTTHATLDFIQTIEDSIEKNEYAIGVFCDLSKAFDTLNHKVLLTKLEHYGIRGSSLQWFTSYLKDRRQYVEWNSCKSSTALIETGVPQGSILGPLLFLLYINDLPSATRLKCIMYADDTNLLIKGRNIEQLVIDLNQELEYVNDFFKANQLKLNAKKTKIILFQKKNAADDSQLQVFLNSEKLEFEKEARFLGLTIDNNLSWEKHCSNVANTISRNNSLINRAKKLLPSRSLKLLYNSFTQPHLQYGVAAWGGCTGRNKKRIISIQKRTIRTISKSYFSSHTEPRMKKLGILKFDDLYKQQCLSLVHDCLNQKAPTEIQKLVKLENSQTGPSLRNQATDKHKLNIPLRKTRAGSSSFRAKGPTFWNILPNELKNITKRNSFCKRIKSYFLYQYQIKCECNNPRCRDKRHH